ncbi:hypothetical protein AAGV28_04270 [Flavobacterium sp. FZUC8N2.13]|uniref:Lipoprotein n=1 Tax=Flavobacterium zubiriense TaxID=3138075 RepID=A0ABV4TCB3_9FLAO
MKNIGLFFVLLVCISFESCKNNEEKKETKAAKIETDTIVSTACYKAIYENDTIDLKVNTLQSGNVSGNMLMKVFKMPSKVGEISGQFHGDTLFASYTFIEGTNEKKTFKNPMAFLKKEDELILGNGQIETSMGASYFVKGEPIDFDRVKYKFSTVDCEEK